MPKYQCYNCKWFRKGNPKSKNLDQYDGCAAIENFTDDVTNCAITVLVIPELVEYCLHYTEKK